VGIISPTLLQGNFTFGVISSVSKPFSTNLLNSTLLNKAFTIVFLRNKFKGFYHLKHADSTMAAVITSLQ